MPTYQLNPNLDPDILAIVANDGRPLSDTVGDFLKKRMCEMSQKRKSSRNSK